jgi:GNAT superfamily N-acetyltransferase
MYLIRKAKPQDIPFLMDCILAAEGFAGKSTYEIIFDLDRNEIKQILTNIFNEGIENQEICVNSFAVVEYKNQLVAGCAAWIEGKDGIGSGTLKATAFSFYVSEKLVNNPKIEALAKVNIPRTMGAIQLEGFYTIPDFRGKKISNLLIDFHIGNLRNADVHKAEIITVTENTSAIRAYQNAGFKIIENSFSDDPLVKEILGGSGKTLLARKI